jgi:hypothetical protein
MSSSAENGPFLSPPDKWFTHRLRQSLFVRLGSFSATQLQSGAHPISAATRQSGHAYEAAQHARWYGFFARKRHTAGRNNSLYFFT